MTRPFFYFSLSSHLSPVYAIMVNDKHEKPALELHEASRDESKPERRIADPAPASQSTASIAGIIAAVVVLTLVLVVGVAALVKRRRQTGRRGRNEVRHSVVVVEEENGEQAEGERRSQAMGLLGECDPREWFSRGAGFLAEETTTGRQGGQELALLGEGMEREREGEGEGGGREGERGVTRERERERTPTQKLYFPRIVV